MRIRIVSVLLIIILLAGTFACGRKKKGASGASKPADVIGILAEPDTANPAPKGADSVKTLAEKSLQYLRSGCDYSIIADVHDQQAYLALLLKEDLYRDRNLSFAEAMDKAALLLGDADTLSKTDPELAQMVYDETDAMDPDEYVSEYMNDLRNAMRNGEISESDEHYDRYRKMLEDWDKGAAYMLEHYPELTEREKPEYTAYTTMYIYTNTDNNQAGSDPVATVNLIGIYQEILKSNRFLRAVADRFNEEHPEYANRNITADSLSEMISVSIPSGTKLIRVEVKTEDRYLSADIANAIAYYASDEIVEIVGAGEVAIVDYATVPNEPSGTHLTKNTIPIGLEGALQMMRRFARFEFNDNLKRFATLECEYRPENTFVGEDGICSYDLGKVTEDNDVWEISMLYYVKDSVYYLIGYQLAIGSIGG